MQTTVGKRRMERARYRALAAVPPATLEELAPSRGTVALRCRAPGCARCADFEVQGRDAFEASLGVDLVVPWDCGHARRRDLALAAGVTAVPAYVVLEAGGGVRVLRPPA